MIYIWQYLIIYCSQDFEDTYYIDDLFPFIIHDHFLAILNIIKFQFTKLYILVTLNYFSANDKLSTRSSHNLNERWEFWSNARLWMEQNVWVKLVCHQSASFFQFCPSFCSFAVFDIKQLFIKTILLFMNKNKAAIIKQIHHPASTRNLTDVGVLRPD